MLFLFPGKLPKSLLSLPGDCSCSQLPPRAFCLCISCPFSTPSVSFCYSFPDSNQPTHNQQTRTTRPHLRTLLDSIDSAFQRAPSPRSLSPFPNPLTSPSSSMAENPGANAPSSWFRAFSRSNNANLAAAKQSLDQCPSPTISTPSSSLMLRNPLLTTTVPPANAFPDQIHRLSHHHRNPTPTPPIASQSLTTLPAESPSRSLHQKSASATLRSVSSFLSLKGAKAGSACAQKPAARANPSSHGIRNDLRSPTSPVETAFSNPNLVREPGIHPPAPLAMLPLTEVDYGSDSDGYTGHRVCDREGREMGRGRGPEGSKGEGTWCNPMLMRTVERLGAVMARKGPDTPLSSSYDSCVFSLIEGFYRLTQRLRDTEEKLAELKDLRERELDQFRGMSEEWMETAETYKAEIKRLELALAKESQDGVASVALVRQGSLVDRAGSKRFQARVRRINRPSEPQAPDNPGRSRQSSSSPEPPDLTEATSSYRTLGAIPRILDSTNDVSVSRILEQREYEEAKARHQTRTQGRVRAPPVIIRAHNTSGLHNSDREMPEDGNPSALIMPTEASRDGPTWPIIDGSIPGHPANGAHPHSHSIPTLTGGPALLSSSSSEPEPSGLSFAGKRKERKSKAVINKQSASKPRQHKNTKLILPRLKIKRDHRSFQDLSHNLESNKPIPRRCYSFEKGEEVLTVTSPVSPDVPTLITARAQESSAKGAKPTTTRSGAQRFLFGLTDAPSGTAEEEDGLYMRPRHTQRSLKSSASVETVHWRGEAKESKDAGRAERGKGDGTK
ncbi:hypothetical protein VTJ83DRAFT_5673 [Remersonia thermophila]|uniref:Uncharacterized protein n=1 Tax=Remersonia thermophila TaxID=72144 RepID=A0ABR4D7K3_9PEZI